LSEKNRKEVQKVTKFVTYIIRKLKLNLSGESIKKLKSLIEMEHPLNITSALPMALTAEAR